MSYFNRGGGGQSSSRGRSNFGRDDRGGCGGGFSRGGDRQMHKTTCSNCGKDCEVPFRPTSGKPVYCSDCFEKMGDRRSDRPERSDRSDRPSFSHTPSSNPSNEQLIAINAKLDRLIKLLEPKAVEVITPTEKEVVVEIEKAPKKKKVAPKKKKV